MKYILNLSEIAIVSSVSLLIVLLTPKRRAKGKFHYPTAGGVFKKLKKKIKIFFSFRNCKK